MLAPVGGGSSSKPTQSTSSSTETSTATSSTSTAETTSTSTAKGGKTSSELDTYRTRNSGEEIPQLCGKTRSTGEEIPQLCTVGGVQDFSLSSTDFSEK